MKPTVVTAETPLLARKDGAAPAKTRRLAHIFIACALAIAAIVGALYVHGGAPLPFARSASGSDVDVAGDDHARPIHWSPYDRVRVVNADPQGLLPSPLSAHTSLTIPARDAFQLQLTPLNSTPTFARIERPSAPR